MQRWITFCEPDAYVRCNLHPPEGRAMLASVSLVLVGGIATRQLLRGTVVVQNRAKPLPMTAYA